MEGVIVGGGGVMVVVLSGGAVAWRPCHSMETRSLHVNGICKNVCQ